MNLDLNTLTYQIETRKFDAKLAASSGAVTGALTAAAGIGVIASMPKAFSRESSQDAGNAAITVYAGLALTLLGAYVTTKLFRAAFADRQEASRMEAILQTNGHLLSPKSNL